MINTGKKYNEPRLVKPKINNDNILSNIEWKIFEKEQWIKDDLCLIDDVEEEINPYFKIYLNNDEITKKNLAKENFNLAIIYEHTILRQSLTLYDECIDSIDDHIFEIPFDFKEDILWDNHSRIRFYVYSNKDQSEIDVIYGQIISSKKFRFSESRETTNLYNPIPLTPEEFAERGYSKGTAFVPIVNSSALDSSFDECSEIVEILISKDLSDLEHPAILDAILLETIEEILVSGWSEHDYESLEDDSILKNLTIRVARSAGIKDPYQIVRNIKNKEISKIKSYLQHGFNYKKHIKGLLDL